MNASREACSVLGILSDFARVILVRMNKQFRPVSHSSTTLVNTPPLASVQ